MNITTNMYKNNKILSSFACVLCLMLILSGCSGKTAADGTVQPDQSEQTVQQTTDSADGEASLEASSSQPDTTEDLEADEVLDTPSEVTEVENSSVPATEAENTESQEPVFRDFAGELKLDMTTDSLKQEVTVKSFVDGDTTHFFVPLSISENGVLKARYLAINTPESTGKIEEYGKKASVFTKEKLSNATSIIIESDDSTWDLDSTGGRYLVWVWYRTNENEDYRNLNIEILQNGLAIASSSANNRYGTTAVAAIANAKALKLNIYSGEKDPDFYYGDAQELTLKELRTHLDEYLGVKVAFEGGITRNNDNGIYIEEYDPDTDRYYGMMVYYGFGLSGEGLDILCVGNRARIVGTVQYYENGGTYQISGLTYRQMRPKDPGNIQKLGDGYEPAYVPCTAEEFVDGAVMIEVDGEKKVYSYAELAMDTTISMKGLTVTGIYTTSNEESSSFGAMTMTCKSEDGYTVTVRTNVLLDENRELIKDSAYMEKNIDVRGLVAYYDGGYQIKVLSAEDITINY